MLGRPALWAALLDRLADLAIVFLRVQAEAGASALQLFDSWAGALTPREYAACVLPASAKVLAAVADLSGHVFNLGHGVAPDTDPDVLLRVVERVRQRSAR